MKEGKIMKTLFNRARNYCNGALESRLVARMETEGRELTNEETKAEAQYILETIDYAGYEPEETKLIKRACRQVLKNK